MLLSLALQTVFGVAAAFAPNFPVYVTLRFIIGMTVSGVIINAFVLGETWSPKVLKNTNHLLTYSYSSTFFFCGT